MSDEQKKNDQKRKIKYINMLKELRKHKAVYDLAKRELEIKMKDLSAEIMLIPSHMGDDIPAEKAGDQINELLLLIGSIAEKEQE